MSNLFWFSLEPASRVGLEHGLSIFRLIATQASFWMVVCKNNELLGRNWWITFIFALSVPFILLLFIFYLPYFFPTPVFFSSLFYLVLLCLIFYLVVSISYFSFFFFLCFINSCFLLTCPLILLMCLPVSSFIYFSLFHLFIHYFLVSVFLNSDYQTPPENMKRVKFLVIGVSEF